MTLLRSSRFRSSRLEQMNPTSREIRVASPGSNSKGNAMIRRLLHGALAASGVALFLAPAAGFAQIGNCTLGVADCSLETRLLGKDLCNDGVDNDGNGLCDATGCGSLPADPHCASEVLCQDGFDNDLGGGTDGADSDCICVTQANPSVTNCTANDIAISYTSNPTVSDGCINSSDTVVAQLTAQITSSSPDRYDIGMWLALDGGSALNSNLCVRDILQPATVAAGTVGPFNDPYARLDGDTCGDSPKSSVSTYTMPFLVNVPCSDQVVSAITGQNGWIDLGQCGSWDNNAGTTCNNSTQALPGTAAKCRCERADSTIPGPNFLAACTNFATPTGLGSDGVLTVGDRATYTFSYTNSVANCTPGSPAPGDPFGRSRCGTASFIRIVVTYPSTASTSGTFYYVDDTTNLDTLIPTCPSTGVLDGNVGVVCNDPGSNHLVFAPRDPNPSNTLGVISPFSSSRSLPFKYELTSPVSGAFQFVASIWWDDLLDTNPSPANTIDAAEAVSLTGAIQQTCGDCSCTTEATTTPITLSSFRAEPAARGVQVDWSTATEVGNVGFNVYAEVGGRKVRLNTEPIPSQSLDSLELRSYSANLPMPDDAQAFFIEDLDVRGGTKSHGPFKLGKKYGADVAPLPIDWSRVRRENGLSPKEDARALNNSRGGGRQGFATTERTSTAGATLNAGATPALPAIELFVDRDGLYRITYEQLLAAGFDLAQQASAQLGLTAQGQPVPIWVTAGTRFGPGSYFEFWGQGVDTIYTRTNVYRLLTGQKKPARAGVSTATATGAAAPSYLEKRHFERNLGYAMWSPSTDPFYDSMVWAFSSASNWPYNFDLDGLVPPGGGARLRVTLSGLTSWADKSPDHHVQVLLNETLVEDRTFDGSATLVVDAPLPAGLLVEGTNTLTLRVMGDTGVPYDFMTLEHYEVTYPRAFAAQSGSLGFTASGGRFEVTGLPTAQVAAYRRDGSALTRLAAATTPDGGSFRAVVPGSGASASYAVASDGALLAPSAIRAARPLADIKTGPASYLVIAHAAFIPGLGELVAERAAQGHSVKVVDVEDIYSQFRGGVFDAEAIRDYVGYAYRSMGTHFVLLVGADNYDYLNYLGTGALSFVPSLYRATGGVVFYTPADSAYADVDRDGVQDLAIGRFPVRTPQELANLVEKTLQYAGKSYPLTGAFAADYDDPDANETFRFATERMITALPAGWQADRIYMDQLTLAAARTRLFGDIAAGQALTLYLGHSAEDSWGSPLKPLSQSLFTVNDVAQLANEGRPTVVAQFGCFNNYYVYPAFETLGPRLTLAEDRGAAAVMGSTTITEDAHGNRFGAILTPMLAQPGATIGEAIWQAKQKFAKQTPANSDVRDVLLGWTLLGDPALQLQP